MAESAAELESLLKGLQEMQVTNPEAITQAMQALGMPVGEGPSMLDDPSSLTQMAEAIKHMRSSTDQATSGDNVLLAKNPPPQQKGITITPRPGFAFKTTRVRDGMKVVVNMAEHEAIDAPAMKKKLDENGEEVEGMNIPMSVGAPVWSEDKKGAKCVIYDIIVNPIVITEATADKTGKYRDFICQLGMQYLEQKYKEELDKRYKLPKLKYMGDTIASQMIQDRKSMPKIEEVSSTTNPSSSGGKGKGPAAQSKGKGIAVEVLDKDLSYTVEWLHAAPGDTVVSASTAQQSAIEAFATGASAGPWQLQPYTHQSAEYLDPIVEPESTAAAIVITTDVNSYDLNVPELSVQISPYKVVLKLPGYKKATVHLACAVRPAESHYFLTRPYEGCVSAVRLRAVLAVDHDDWAAFADAGSKPWLLTLALSAEEDGQEANPYNMHRSSGNATTAASRVEDDGREVFAEDKFHLKLPEDVDPYTGVKLDGEAPDFDPLPGNRTLKPARPQSVPQTAPAPEEESELPEDRFHKKDASSTYLINQREQAKRDKWAKYEKEKAERADDPNVEYIDMDDFRAGGKFGPSDKKTADGEESAPGGSGGQRGPAQSEELRRAAEVVATSTTAAVGGQQGGGLQLSSALWTELLD